MRPGSRPITLEGVFWSASCRSLEASCSLHGRPWFCGFLLTGVTSQLDEAHLPMIARLQRGRVIATVYAGHATSRVTSLGMATIVVLGITLDPAAPRLHSARPGLPLAEAPRFVSECSFPGWAAVRGRVRSAVIRFSSPRSVVSVLTLLRVYGNLQTIPCP